MKYDNLISNLRQKISDQLSPLLAGKTCVLLEVPHHENIGDLLIWQGEVEFLKHCNGRILFQQSLLTFDWRPIDKDVIILLNGGGNFGDLWFHHHKFKREIIQRYPDNKIIILPSTVYFEDENNLKEDIAIFSEHKDVTICVRDNLSYITISQNYPNQVLLMPDMAFWVNVPKGRKKNNVKQLFIKRGDKELSDNNSVMLSEEMPKCDQRDWPSFETSVCKRMIKIRDLLHNHPSILNVFWSYICKPYMIKTGIKMIQGYDTIYTTRLHGAILSILLDKEVYIYDNSYGKNKSFYDTWLVNQPQIHLLANK